MNLINVLHVCVVSLLEAYMLVIGLRISNRIGFEPWTWKEHLLSICVSLIYDAAALVMWLVKRW